MHDRENELELLLTEMHVHERHDMYTAMRKHTTLRQEPAPCLSTTSVVPECNWDQTITRLAIHEFFDVTWAPRKGRQEYSCDSAAIREIAKLSPCPGGDYACYPFLRDGRSVIEHAKSDNDDVVMWRAGFGFKGEELWVDSRPKLVCSLIEGYGFVNAGNESFASIDELATQQWVAIGDHFKAMEYDVRMPQQAILMMPGTFALLRLLQVPAQEGGMLEIQEVREDDTIADLIEKMEKQWETLVLATNLLKKSLGNVQAAINNIKADARYLFDVDWSRGGNDCKTNPPTNASIDGCAEAVQGEMFDVITPEKIREKFEADIERKLEDTVAMDDESEFTWNFNGDTAVFFQFASVSGWEYCTPDYSQIQLSWAPNYVQRIRAVQSRSGRVQLRVVDLICRR